MDVTINAGSLDEITRLALQSRNWQERAEAAEAEVERLREVHIRCCECSPDEACQFARERDESRAEVVRLREQVAELTARLSDCRTTDERLDELARSIHITDRTLNTEFERIETRMAALEQRVQETTVPALNVDRVTNATLANLLIAMQFTMQRIDELESKMAALEKRQPNDAYIQMHGQRLAEIERRLAGLEEDKE